MDGSGKMDEPNTTFGNQEARFEGENKSDAHERERSREALRCFETVSIFQSLRTKHWRLENHSSFNFEYSINLMRNSFSFEFVGFVASA